MQLLTFVEVNIRIYRSKIYDINRHESQYLFHYMELLLMSYWSCFIHWHYTLLLYVVTFNNNKKKLCILQRLM